MQDESKVYVTLDWAGNPITTKGDGCILPRSAEMIINGKYYPTKTVGEWPCDPETGEKLPAEPMRGMSKKPSFDRNVVEQRIAKAWTWLAKQKNARCHDPNLGDCFKAHTVLIALKMVAEDCGGNNDR